jgi:hypothetical protein
VKEKLKVKNLPVLCGQWAWSRIPWHTNDDTMMLLLLLGVGSVCRRVVWSSFAGGALEGGYKYVCVQ